MSQRYSRYIPFISLTGDFIIMNALLVGGFIWLRGVDEFFQPYFLGFTLYLNVVWFSLVVIFGAHRIDRNTRPRSFFITYIQVIVFFFFFFLMFFQIKPFEWYPREWWKYIFPLYFVLLIVWKMALFYAFVLYRRLGFNFRKTIVVGNDVNGAGLQNYFINNRWHGYRFQGYFSEEETDDINRIGRLDDLAEFLENHHIDEVYIAWSSIPREKLNGIFAILDSFPIKVRVIPDLQDFSFQSVEIIKYGNIPVIQIHPGPLSYGYNRLVKRVFDMVVALIIIVGIMSWLTPVLWILSMAGSREKVFFQQRRTAANGGEFICLKYRSMRSNTKADEVAATRDDQRITRVGRFLRKTSLDEIPQFINVLKGEMSVVGPRPHMLKHTEEYRRLTKRFMLRHTVKPGITGLAQINGFRGEITSVRDIEKRVEFDVRYIENWTFNLDLRIMLRTFLVFFKRQDKAY